MKSALSFERVRNTAMMLAFGVSIIPFLMYITDDTSGLLWLMMAANIFAYIMIALTTIRITLDVANREKSKLAVPAKYADDPVRSKWYTAVKLSQRWHLLAVIPRFALALGWMQWFHTTSFECIKVTSCCIANRTMNAYCYTSQQGGYAPLPLAPQPETIVIASILLILVTLAEVRLLPALALTIQRYVLADYQAKTGLVIVIRSLSLLMVLGLVQFSEPIYWRILYSPDPDGYTLVPNWRDVKRVHETGITALMMLNESGVLVAANIMRPVGESTVFATYYEIANDAARSYIPHQDNRPFVLRQVAAGWLGLLLYALLTRGMLRLAGQGENRGMSPTYP